MWVGFDRDVFMILKRRDLVKSSFYVCFSFAFAKKKKKKIPNGF